jgi:hypothetical protein
MHQVYLKAQNSLIRTPIVSSAVRNSDKWCNNILNSISVCQQEKGPDYLKQYYRLKVKLLRNIMMNHVPL